MSLTNPSIGQYIDRLSILRLKIAQGERLQQSVGHFEQERKEILDRLPPEVSFNGPLVEELFFVNEALWELTDEMRGAITECSDAVQAKLGRLILRHNDRRAILIAKIAAEHGDHRVEKLHAPPR